MNTTRKILLIDNASDRKQRIKALADRGYTVFPALRMEEARSRCTRAGYDLIVVHADGEQQQAIEFCDEIRKACPRQALLLSGDGSSGRDYAISGGMESLVHRVDDMLQESTKSDLAAA
jgi:DNA-binding response OmpR family regulator